MIVGIDEAGRGAWAGPLVAAAVLMDKPVSGLNDSKLISPKRRLQLFEIINDHYQVGVGVIQPVQIDSHGLSWAVGQAMLSALKALNKPSYPVIVDGPIDYIASSKSSALIRADQTIPAVMAASIVAKVTRDKLMEALDKNLPGYDFASHKGYGTAGHLRALKSNGVSSQHRHSYKPIAALL